MTERLKKREKRIEERKKCRARYGSTKRYIFSVVAMVLLLFSLLLTSVQIAAYGDKDYGFYRNEYEKYFIPHALHMDIDDIMVVTGCMMDYLIGKEDILSVDTEIDGTMQDFFNEQDKLHLADVKRMFLGGLKLRNICLILSLILLLGSCFYRGRYFALLRDTYFRVIKFFGVVALLLAIAFTIDFSDCFTVFHKLLFSNNLWMFDASSDYMIRMLPEEFFEDMAIRIAIVFGTECILAGGFFIGLERLGEKKKGKDPGKIANKDKKRL